MIKLNTKKGFTLIELLVVIAIIGVLAALVTASINDSRAKSRDAARISQLKELSTALELYYLDNDSYPNFGARLLNNGNIVSALVPDYIRSIPNDPLYTGNQCSSGSASNSNYCYQVANGGQGYAIRTTLESSSADHCIVSVNYSGVYNSSADCSSI